MTRKALLAGDFRARARHRLPRPVFDYVEGGADEEISIADNAAAFRRFQFTPASLRAVGEISTATTLLGQQVPAPLGLSPAGYTHLLHPEGEVAPATAAARAGIPYSLSTVASTTIEQIAAATGRPPWVQLYVLKDRPVTHDMLRRAAEAGSQVIEVTIDTMVGGNRLRDERNRFVIPPRRTLPWLARVAAHPGYWWSLAQRPFTLANVAKSGDAGTLPLGRTFAEITGQFDPDVTWDDIADLRERWKGKLLIKGPISATDAARAAALGADGVHLSNHGGRQLDRVVVPIELVREMRDAAGPEFTIIVDSGVRSGLDVAIAVALGADAAFVGRAYLWGLAAEGVPGVERVIRILTVELSRTMQLLGVASVSELRERGAELVRGRP